MNKNNKFNVLKLELLRYINGGTNGGGLDPTDKKLPQTARYVPSSSKSGD